MILKSIGLSQFKNHNEVTFNFNERLNCILGKNGAGKTNLLDSIYYLSFGKSALASSDRISIQHSFNHFTLFGNYDFGTIALQFESGKTKTVKIDGIVPEKLRDLVGKVPLVLILPEDTSMIKDGSEDRRKFFDGALCQFDIDYLEKLLKFNKLLKQRNSLLKQSESGTINYKLVETYDDQIIPLSIEISAEREKLLHEFIPHLTKTYQELHDGKEFPSIVFKTQVDNSFEETFRNNFQRDSIMQRTMLGSHRDDFVFSLNDELIKTFGSQGQQKTFIISLKFALYDFLSTKTETKPLLLLDDIFDKLDDSRIQLLIKMLSDESRFGQIFITDARAERSRELFSNSEVNFIAL